MADPLILARVVHFAATVLAAGTIGFTVLVAEPAVHTAGFMSFAKAAPPVDCVGLARARRCGDLGRGLAGSAGIRHPGYVDCPTYACTAAPGPCSRIRASGWCGASASHWHSCSHSYCRGRRRDGSKLPSRRAFLALPALVGHAGATPGLAGDLHLVSDMLHLLAAGAWLGGLPAFAFLLLRARRSAGRAPGRSCGAGGRSLLASSVFSASEFCWRAASSTAGTC